MNNLVADMEALLAGMEPSRKAELRKLVAGKLKQIWLPNPGVQTLAYLSDADMLLFGGAAGGGKTDLLLGTALTSHMKGVIFRRAFVDLYGAEDRLIEILKTREGYNASTKIYKSKDNRVLEFGSLEKPGAEFSWQGRPHDFIGFDEGAQLSEAKVAYVCGWLRSTAVGQRKRIIIATNPPSGGEGHWIIQWFAPWLDPLFPNPALPGELRWAITVHGQIRWMDGPGQTVVEGHTYTHESRTFIPASLDDNPYLKDTGYRARLENLPEPLRSQLLYGDFMAGREDHEQQVIPTSWVKAAQQRWRESDQHRRRTMIALAGDIALGGNDNVALAPLYEDAWFGPLIMVKGAQLDDPADIASLMIKHRRDGADLSVDATGGWGSGVKSHLRHQHAIEVAGIVFSRASVAKARDSGLGFANLRAEMYWRLREALSPDSKDDIKLPPDPRLEAELTTPRYKMRGTDILIEDKDEIRKRLGGSSVDRADAVVMAWHRRTAAIRKSRDAVPGLPLPEQYKPPVSIPGRNDSWMLG